MKVIIIKLTVLLKVRALLVLAMNARKLSQFHCQSQSEKNNLNTNNNKNNNQKLNLIQQKKFSSIFEKSIQLKKLSKVFNTSD